MSWIGLGKLTVRFPFGPPLRVCTLESPSGMGESPLAFRRSLQEA
jgi:hypothetical protein